MKYYFFKLLLLALLWSHANSAWANGSVSTDLSELEEKLQDVFVGRTIEVSDYDEQIKFVTVDAEEFYFVSHDGRYIFGGMVIDVQRRLDLIQEQHSQRRLALLTSQPQSSFISYPSVNQQKHLLTVFTDIDCPYCRKFHNSIRDLNKLGISVNYVMLPRSGKPSVSYDKALIALCSDDPASSITRAMQNQTLDGTRCDPAVLDQQMALAKKLEIDSTPTILLPNGQLKVGSPSVDQIVSLLSEDK